MRKYWWVTLCVFGLCAELLAAGNIYIVDGRKIEVSLKMSQPTIMLGEPTYFYYVVKNHSDQDLQVVVGGDYRNGLGRPDSFRISVKSESGENVDQLKTGFGMGGFVGPKKIPAKGEYTFDLFLPHWATFEKPGEYSIEAKRILHVTKFGDEDWHDYTNLNFGKPASQAIESIKVKPKEVLVRANSSIKVEPLDQEKMGALISKLGRRMLEEKGEKVHSARRALLAIHDERVIPHFLKALETNNYSQKFGALRALEKFNTDEAFEGLKKGMDTWPGDVDSPGNIRHGAASALARSPHPGAIDFLLTRQNDPYSAVRNTIVQASKKMKREDAFSMLKKMQEDKDERVRGEAHRYFKMLFPVSRNPS